MNLIIFFLFFALDYECYEEGSVYGFEYNEDTKRCSCKPGWTGDKCEGKLKLITQVKFNLKRCETH